MSNVKISRIMTGSGMTIFCSNMSKPFTMSSDHNLYQELVAAVSSKDIKAIEKIIDRATAIKEYSNGVVKIINGTLLVNDTPVHSVLVDRIISMFHQDIDFEYMIKFLYNLMQNPSDSSRQELYMFLENGDMPITDDGRFLAYKWVTDDYMDCHTRTFSNRVGAVVSMPRHKVDANRHNTCSSGLHVCTHAYTKFGTRLMVVAVNPAHVVSVPIDYDNAKMRVSEYEVLYEVGADEYNKFDKNTPVMPVVKSNPTLPARDKLGRFVSSK